MRNLVSVGYCSGQGNGGTSNADNAVPTSKERGHSDNGRVEDAAVEVWDHGLDVVGKTETRGARDDERQRKMYPFEFSR